MKSAPASRERPTALACIVALLSALAFPAFAGGPHGSAPGHGAPQPAITGPVSVEKATGPDARTVAEVFEKRAELDGRSATVRAVVVKVSRNIMGKNWIHLRDGSGDETKGTNRLVVTSQDLPAVGEVVTARGTLHKDRDFGYGYRYEMIMEDASLTR